MNAWVDSQAPTKKPPSQVAFLLQTFVKLGHNAELQRSEFEGLFVWRFRLRNCGRRRTQLVFLARAFALDTARAVIQG